MGTWVNFCWVCAAGLSEPLPPRDGTVVRALASHQCGPGLVPGPGLLELRLTGRDVPTGIGKS